MWCCLPFVFIAAAGQSARDGAFVLFSCFRKRRAHSHHFHVSHCRGRCPHRPAGNARFMAVFRRIRGIVISRRRGGQGRPPLQMVLEKPRGSCEKTPCFPLESCVLPGRCGHRPLHEVVFPIPYRRGRCPHRPAGNARFMAVFRRIRGIVISRRRGGRPCPPAGIVRFYGNPMRNRNNSMGGQGRPPLQMVLEKPRGSCEKTPCFPLESCVLPGRCGHRPLQPTS